MSERFTVEVDITAKDKTSQALKGVKGGFDEAFNEILTGAFRRAGESALDFAKQIPGMIVDLGKLGVSVEASERRFTQFAGGADKASMFLDAFNEGSLNTVDRMTAMSSAGRLLQMGLVKTGDEMSSIAAMATQLGDQTMGAGERIADFAALLANQSIPRLDNFGISSGRVRQRIDELLKSGQALNREQAFKMAVMEEGKKALDTLGDTSDTAAVRIGKMTAAWNTLKQEMGVIVMEDAASAINALSTEAQSADEVIRGLPERFREWREHIQETTFAHRASNEEIRAAREEHQRYRTALESSRETEYALTIAMADNAAGHRQYADAMNIANAQLDLLTMSGEEYRQGLRAANSMMIGESVRAFDQYQAAIKESMEAQDRAVISRAKFTEQLRLEAVQAMETAEKHLDTAMQYVDFEQDRLKTARDFEDKRAVLERKHQDKMADLAKRGQARRVQIDTVAEQEKLDGLQERLAIALQQQSEFTDKTKESSRMSKERQIATLEEQIAQQTQLLDDYYAGRLWRAGENVDGLIAEENRHYEESLVSLEEAQAEQEEAQRESLGRMVLAHFNAWAEMNLAADGYTKEEAQFVQQMRMDISKEYGLVTDAAITAMNEQETKWSAMIAQMQGDASGFFDYFMQEFNSLPSEKIIRIRTELATPQTEEGRLGGEAMQRGSAFAGGGWALVGERGPEMAYIPRGASVYPADQSRHMTNNYNLTVNSAATAGRLSDEFALMESLAA